MVKYCEFCRELHDENQLCERYKRELKKHPQWLSEATEFATLAAQYHLITSQTLDKTASAVNKVLNTNLSYEGTHQALHDIMTFKQLSVDAFAKSSVFSSPDSARRYLDSLENTKALMAKLGGTSKEVEVMMRNNGSLKGLFSNTTLYGEAQHNMPGVDGVTKVYKVFGGKETRFSVKSTQYKVTPGHSTIDSIFKSIENGDFVPGDIIEGTQGYEQAFKKRLEQEIAKANASGNTQKAEMLKRYENTKVNESGTSQDIRADAERQKNKMAKNKAYTEITGSEVASKMLQGAIVGAAISLSVSSLTNFIRYKKGELSAKEAFRDVGEDTVKGALVGGTMAGVTLFLPGGIIGFAAGMAIGVYVSTVFGNVLDEIFGKGYYAELLHAEGYIVGTAKNIEEMMREFGKNVISTQNNNRASSKTLAAINSKEKTVSDKLSKLADSMEGL